MAVTRYQVGYIKEFLQKHHVIIAKDQGDELLCHCPFHHDTHPSFAINKHTGLHICYAGCTQGSFVKLVAALEHCSLEDAHRKVHGSASAIHRIRDRIQSVRTTQDRQPLSHKKMVLLPRTFEMYRELKACPSYLLQRLQWPTIQHFRLGQCHQAPYHHHIIIPIIEQHAYVGFVARDYTGHTRRYLVPPGFAIKQYLFNIDNLQTSRQFRQNKEVILVEGVFDAMSMYEKRFDNALATFGASLSLVQIRKLIAAGVRVITMCYDNDDHKPRNTGQEMMNKLAAKLRYYFDAVFIMHLPSKTDPNQATIAQLHAAYENKIRVKY
jgi:DNA primase